MTDGWPSSSVSLDRGKWARGAVASIGQRGVGPSMRGGHHSQGSKHARRYATVLFTDIEDSTPSLARMGDDEWARVLDAHDRTAAKLIYRYRGWLVKTVGDGVLAVFSDASNALHCATSFTPEVIKLGIVVRSGLHSGEFLITDTDISGLTVHIAARVASGARGGEVRLSEATRALLHSALDELTDCGRHRLKGVPGEWRLFAVMAEPGRYARTA